MAQKLECNAARFKEMLPHRGQPKERGEVTVVEANDGSFTRDPQVTLAGNGQHCRRYQVEICEDRGWWGEMSMRVLAALCTAPRNTPPSISRLDTGIGAGWT